MKRSLAAKVSAVAAGGAMAAVTVLAAGFAVATPVPASVAPAAAGAASPDGLIAAL
jgi:hypothetical protein